MSANPEFLHLPGRAPSLQSVSRADRRQHRTGGAEAGRLAASAEELHGPSSRQALRSGRWKLIRGADGRGRLYDLETDPDELHDVAAEQPAVRGELDALLDQLMARNPPRFAGRRPIRDGDAER